MVPPDECDDDFAVWPFRRQLVDRFVREDDTLPPVPPRPPVAVTQTIAVVRPAPRRTGSPLRVVVPVALAAFCAAIAGAAALGNRGAVPELRQEIVPAAEAASAPKAAVRRPAATRIVFVPDVVGLDRKHAVARLAGLKFRARVRLAAGEPGLVLAQTPVAATGVKRTGVVAIVVGRRPKPRPAAVPQVPHGGARADAGASVRVNVSSG